MIENQAYNHENPPDYQWTRKAFELLTEGKLKVTINPHRGHLDIRATGTCPYCTHNVNYSFCDIDVQPRVPGVLGVDVVPAFRPETMPEFENDLSGILPHPKYAVVEIVCCCQGEHPGRPASIRWGCGITFSTEIRVEP